MNNNLTFFLKKNTRNKNYITVKASHMLKNKTRNIQIAARRNTPATSDDLSRLKTITLSLSFSNNYVNYVNKYRINSVLFRFHVISSNISNIKLAAKA